MCERALRCLLGAGVLSGILLLPVAEGFAQDAAVSEARVSLVGERQRLAKAAGVAVTGGVLALREGGLIVGLDSLSLRQRWSFDQYALIAGPFRAGEHLFAVSSRSTSGSGRDGSGGRTYKSLIELDPKTGSVIWTQEMETSEAQPIFGCGEPAFLFNENTLFWNVQNATPTKLEIPGSFTGGLKKIDWRASWLSAHHLVVAGEGTVRADDLADPTQTWSNTLSGKIKRIRGCGATLLVELEGGSLVGVEESSGRVLWRMVLGRDQALVDAGAGGFFTIDPRGSRKWIDPQSDSQNNRQNSARQPLAPLTPAPGSIRNVWYTPGVLVVEDAARGVLKLYDSASGKLLWTGQPSEPEKPRSQSPLSLLGEGVARWLGPAETEGARFDLLDGYLCVSSGSGLLQVLGISRAQPLDASPSQASSGALDVRTDPEDAFLWVDGFLVAQGVRRIQGLAPGPHRLSVFHPDREVYEGTVDVKAEGVQEVDIVLDRIRGVGLSINTNPNGAVIYIDGRNTGFATPYAFYDYAPGQILNVQLFKLGYGELQRKVEIEREGTQISEKLGVRSLLGTVFVRTGQTGFGTIKGWNEPDIRAGGVVGRPVKSPSGEAGLGVEANVDLWALRFLALTVRVDADRREFEGEGGIWVSGEAPRKLQVGFSYLYVDPYSRNSKPPSKGWGTDRSAPLERWDHPIPRVFVDDSVRDYLVAHLRARPQADLLLELAVGRLLTTRLRGTALVDGPDGHLVRDPARFYDVRSRSGDLIDFKLRKGLGAFRLWRVFPSTTFEARYRRRTIDFGVARERGQEFTIGLGLMVF